VNKSELVETVADKAGMAKAQVEKMLDSLLNTVMDEVKRGEKVTIPGFGAWSRTQRAARTGRNPRTGEAVQIPASKAAKFTVGAKFKEHVKR
jgi:DNA-binding protein HU-beta